MMGKNDKEGEWSTLKAVGASSEKHPALKMQLA